MTNDAIPVPADRLADLSDQEQVAMIRQTDNRLAPEDAEHLQPEAD